jgi:hypothetical protein
MVFPIQFAKEMADWAYRESKEGVRGAEQYS